MKKNFFARLPGVIPIVSHVELPPTEERGQSDRTCPANPWDLDSRTLIELRKRPRAPRVDRIFTSDPLHETLSYINLYDHFWVIALSGRRSDRQERWISISALNIFKLALLERRVSSARNV